MNVLVGSFSILVLVNTALVLGQSSTCYMCRTYIEGDACNDPVDVSAISRQHCSNFSLVESSLGISNSIRSSLTRDETSTICTKVTYVTSGIFTTLRACEYQYYDEVDFCSYFQGLVDSMGLDLTNFSCSVCTTNLCNSATIVYPSFAIISTIVYFIFATF